MILSGRKFVKHIMMSEIDSAVEEFCRHSDMFLSLYDLEAVMMYSTHFNSHVLYKISLDILNNHYEPHQIGYGTKTAIEKTAIKLGAKSVREMRSHGMEFSKCMGEAIDNIEITYYGKPSRTFLMGVFYDSATNVKLLGWLTSKIKDKNWIPEPYSEEYMVSLVSDAEAVSFNSSKDVLDFLTLRYVHLM